MTLLPLPLAALVEAAPWMKYPLVNLGDTSITVLSIVKIVFWVIVILVLNLIIRQMVLRRVLARTRFEVGLQFAITKIFSYIFVTLGFYVALIVNGVDL